MREQLLNLLDRFDRGMLPKEEQIGTLVLLVERTGFCRWGYALASAATYKTPRNGWAKEHVAIMDLFFGHLAQWCLDDVVDAQRRFLSPEKRVVLDPQFVLDAFHRGDKSLKTILQEVQPVVLKHGEWRDRWQVSAWRLNMATWWVDTKKMLQRKAFRGTLADGCRGFVEDLQSQRLWTAPYPCTPSASDTSLRGVEFPTVA